MKESIVRGVLLRLLYDLRLQMLTRDTINAAMIGYQSRLISLALDYLEQKKYASVESKTHPYQKRESVTVVRITAEGIDLMEGVFKDEGVRIA